MGLQVGDTVVAGETPRRAPATPCRSRASRSERPCTTSSFAPDRGGKVARSAGQQAIVSNREGGYALVKMPSGEIRRFHENCYCTIGQVGNRDHMNEVSGKAGRTRWKGVRPTVRGMCMNPVDHPNGGGEGKSKSGGGRQHLKSPWGHTKGQRTRPKRKASDKFIVQRRKLEEAFLTTLNHATFSQERSLC